MAKILLTDDEAHVRYVMKFKLERAGHEVLTAGDGEEALAAAQRELPELVVSDFQMPRMNGLELCRALYADPRTRAIPVLLVTSREFEIGPEQTRGTGVRRVLSKPFSPTALLHAIEQTLGDSPRQPLARVAR